MVSRLRWLTAGESHGPALTAIIEGLPASFHITIADLDRDLARRRLGTGRGARMKFERDDVKFLGGVRHGQTLGGPIAIEIANTEWPKWEAVMNPEPVDREILDGLARNAPLTRPRPGHADLAGMQKYDFTDARPILERASARETAARVALGAVARAFLQQVAGITLVSHVVRIGSVTYNGAAPSPHEMDIIDASPVRCFDPQVSSLMEEEIGSAHRDGDTLGGVVEVVAVGLPPGLGSYTHWDRRLDSKLAAALMGIQAIKGVEVGDGFDLAAIRGSLAQDEIFAQGDQVRRGSGKSGGTEGGMSTGEMLRVRAAMKPISTIPKALQTIDTATGEAAAAINQRSDVCAVPAAGIVAEAMVALVLAEAILDKFGGDSLRECQRNIAGYLENLAIKIATVVS